MLGLAAFLTGLFMASAAEQPQVRPPAAAPQLVVVISVDQLSADLFDEYRPQFSGGLARLASGTAFRNGYQAHAATETCPGHSTILTGSHPTHSGIIAQHLGRPVRPAVRQDGLLRRRRARRGLFHHQLHRVALPSAGTDVGRYPEATLAAEPQRGRVGQGSGGGDDGRASCRSALVLGWQEVRERLQVGSCPGDDREGECGSCRLACGCTGAIAAAAVLPGEGDALRPHAAADRRCGTLRPSRRRRPFLPDLSGIRRSRSRHRCGAGAGAQAGPRCGTRRAFGRTLCHGLCRPRARLRRRGDVPSAALARPGPGAVSSTCSMRRASIIPSS